MNEPKVIVEISGGVCVGVYSSDENIKAEDLDWDNYKVTADDEEKMDIERIMREAGELHIIY
jgi:hypothetical protein